MKKFVVICAVIFNFVLHAEPGTGQLEQFDFFLRPFKRGVEICKEKEFTHFVIKEMTYEDERGQSLVFKGISDMEGVALISETMTENFAPPVGTATVKCEFLFFKNDPLAIASSRYPSNFINALQKLLIPKNEGNSIRKTRLVEEAMEMTKAMAFTDNPEILDQFTQFALVVLLPLRTVIPTALANNSNYFLVKKIAFKDNRGQSLIFNGISDVEGGILISNNETEEYASPIGTLNVEYEMFFFDELPKEPLVIDIREWLRQEGNSTD